MEPGDQVILRMGPHLEKHGPMTHVKWEKHPDSKNRVMTQVLCKLCHQVIAGQIESDARIPSRVIRGTTFIYKTLTFSRFAAYTEVEIIFDDNSRHVTHICTGCKQQLDDPKILELVYVSDLAQWLWEEQHGHGPALWHVYPECATRVPVAWKDNGGLT